MTLDSASAVSAVIVSYNSGRTLATVMTSLFAQTVPPAEIILVDGGSTDDSVGRIVDQFPTVRLIQLQGNPGPAANRNAGLKAACSDLILLVDADMILAETCLAQLLEATAAAQPAVACPRICLHPQRDVVQCDGTQPHFVGTMTLRHGFRPVRECPVESAFVGGCLTACLLVRRPAILAVGGFDELYFFYFEDLAFSLRLRALGEDILCVPQAAAFHDRGPGTEGLSFRGSVPYPRRRLYLTMRNRWLSMLIHYRARTLLVLAPLLALYELVTLLAALRRRLGREWLRGWLWLVRHRRLILDRRRHIQHRRSRPDAVLIAGGPLPLAPGFLQSRLERTLTTVFSAALNACWRLARPFIA